MNLPQLLKKNIFSGTTTLYPLSDFHSRRTTVKQWLRKNAFVNKVTTVWFWILFFVVVYFILFLKTLTYEAIYTNIFFGIYSIVISTYILSRFLFSYFHKSLPYDEDYTPSVTFVVPAKDEEDNIAETIRRFAKVNYPREKIEVIAINDGSTDRTYDEMVSVAKEIKSAVRRVAVVSWKKNRGKRHGMAEGVRRAKHEIVIFIDSDSFIEPDGVRHLVKHFKNKNVGAVSGHTDVYNKNTNLLTQMQTLRYYISFKVYKAAESIFGSVTCCPGCCSAYRRSYLLPVVDEWLNQRFLNAECTFGDDRSLTNYIIRKYDAIYSRNAIAYTVVPENFKQYSKQQLRWKKSWIRETIIASTFMWRRHPLAAFSFYVYIFLAFISPLVFLRAMFWYPAVHSTWPIIYLTGLFLMLLLHGIYYRAEVGKQPWILAVIHFWFNTIILIWQLPWAAITIRDSRWGTR